MCTLAVWKFIESVEKDICFKYPNSSSGEDDLTRFNCENGHLTFLGKLSANYSPNDGDREPHYIFKTWTSSKSDELNCSQRGIWQSGDWQSPKFAKRPRTMLSTNSFPFKRKN